MMEECDSHSLLTGEPRQVGHGFDRQIGLAQEPPGPAGPAQVDLVEDGMVAFEGETPLQGSASHRQMAHELVHRERSMAVRPDQVDARATRGSSTPSFRRDGLAAEGKGPLRVCSITSAIRSMTRRDSRMEFSAGLVWMRSSR